MSDYVDINRLLQYVFIEFAQNIFSSITDFKWDKEINKSKILISSTFPDVNVRQKNPAIIIAFRQPVESGTISDFGTLASVNWQTGDRQFIDLFDTAMEYICISPNDVEAENLAQILFQTLLMRRHLLYKQGIHSIQNLAYSFAHIADNTSPTQPVYQASVNVHFNFTYNYIIKQAGPKLKNFILAIEAK